MAPASGMPEDEEAEFPPGMRLGRYHVVRALGAGGMGAVYEATHVDIGKSVALKVLTPAVAAIPGARARFLREAQLASRVRHPNIVDVTDMGTEGRHTFLVMELLRGEDLAHRLARGPLSTTEVADIMLPVCSAVTAAHQAGVTHRDLKPQNIFLAAGPHIVTPKVLDFGISKGSDTVGTGSLTGTGAMIGTPFYLAPEQVMDNRSAGPASDQYALGVILYECLTGARPYEGDNLFAVFQTIVAGACLRPGERRPDLSPAMEEIVLRAMHVNATARFGSVEELGRALLSYASDRIRTIWEQAFGGAPAAVDYSRTPSSATPFPRRVPTTPLPPARLGTNTPAPATPRPPLPVSPAPRSPAPMSPVPMSFTPLPPTPLPPTPAPPTPPAPVVGAPSGTRVLDAYKSPAPPPAPSAPPAPARRPSRSRSVHDMPARDFGSDVASSRVPIRIIAIGMVAVAGVIVALVVLQSPDTDADRKARSSRPRESTGTSATTVERAPKPRPRPQTFNISVSVEPERGSIELDGMPAGRGHIERTFPLDGTTHTLRFTADGFEARTIEFTDGPPPRTVVLSPAPRAIPPPPPPPPTHKAGGGKKQPSAVRPRPSAGGVTKKPEGGGDGPRLNPNGAPVLD